MLNVRHLNGFRRKLGLIWYIATASEHRMYFQYQSRSVFLFLIKGDQFDIRAAALARRSCHCHG